MAGKWVLWEQKEGNWEFQEGGKGEEWEERGAKRRVEMMGLTVDR